MGEIAMSKDLSIIKSYADERMLPAEGKRDLDKYYIIYQPEIDNIANEIYQHFKK